ncbi:hypothetical protein KKG41_03140 [Patescibacteria group bacterium]|nr:hypothetical protein [Patescibacteria group bacterium]MBU1890267.1 hypothetical protein [Patescibacteria group bacterium]
MAGNLALEIGEITIETREGICISLKPYDAEVTWVPALNRWQIRVTGDNALSRAFIKARFPRFKSARSA